MALIEGAASGVSALVTKLNPYSAYIKVGLEVLVIAGAGFGGWQMHKGLVYEPHLRKDAQQDLANVEKVRKIEALAQTISSNWAQKLALSKDQINGNTRTVIQAIPVYLPAPARAPGEVRPVAAVDADLPSGAVQLLDYAASGVPAPAPAPGSDLAGRSGIGLPQAVSVIAGNYGTCNAWHSEVNAWRGWYVDLKAKWPVDGKGSK